ncbi:T9SS type A sorting domain-containing protein [bacterium]|nr:T9SS type A sorting domain-containing protein [bacterium]
MKRELYLAIFLILIHVPVFSVSIHQLESEDHIPYKAEGTRLFTTQAEASALKGTVFGFLPYWEVSTANIRFDLLSHIALFSYHFDPADGAIIERNGWPNLSLTNTAHAAGAKVILCVTNFYSGYDYSGFLDNTTARNNLIAALISEVESTGLDGVNIDFEGISSSQKSAFVSFITSLNDGLKNSHPSYELSLCGPAVDWSGAYDYDLLALNSDGIFIMAYDYHWSGDSQAGPVAPLSPSVLWGDYSVQWTIEDYIEWGIYTDKFILGLPYYGYDWPVNADIVPADTLGNAAARTYSYAVDSSLIHGNLWNTDSNVPYYKYIDGDHRQCWYDNKFSISKKIDMADNYSLQGIGIWALGYEDDKEELWDLIESKYGSNEAVKAPLIYPNPTRGDFRLDTEDFEYVDITVRDISGEKIFSMENVESSTIIELKNKEDEYLPPGVYIVTIVRSGQTFHAKAALVY